MQIPITKAIFGEEEKAAIIKPLETGWVVQGPNVQKFQTQFSEFTHSNYAHATTSCTTALHLALIALGIKAGDKVIVPSFTYVASANAVEYTGAEVVFCDIDLSTFNINETALEELIKKDDAITAIMPVNLFGLCANLPVIMEIANRYNLKVVEDSACGFDSWIADKHSGTFGDIGCFSFHPRKSISTGEGGMLITDNENLSNHVSQLKDHGASKSDLQRHKEKGGSLLPDFTMRGYNYRMTDFQGAIGVCQMNKKEFIMNGRRKIATQYDKALADIPQLIKPYTPSNYQHGYQSYVCLFSNNQDLSHLSIERIDALNIQRNELMEKLEEQGIATRQGTHAVHTLSYYKTKYKIQNQDHLMSYAADRLSITLPLYAGMSDEEFDYVISHIKKNIS